MNKPISKLQIRVKLPEEDQPVMPAQDEEIVYRWDRIVGALLGVTLILGLIVAGGWYWLQTPEATAQNEMAAGPESAPTKPSAAPIPAQSVEADEATPVSVSESAATEADAAPVAVANSSAAKPISASVHSPKPLASDNKVRSDQQPAAQPAETQPAEAQLTEAQPAEAQAPVRVFSDHLTHAQLSNAMLNGAPLDHASAVIPMNDKGLIKLYFFTELQDLKGQTVYHDWYLDNERVARITVRPSLDAIKAHSSKFIDQYMLGKWNVKVHTAGGDALASSEFEVR